MQCLIIVVNKLQLIGYTYYDLCWDNLQWNNKSNFPVLLDIDSSIPINVKYEPSRLEGQHTFHVVFSDLKQKTRIQNNMMFFGSSLVINFFTAIITAYYFDSKKLNLVNGLSRVVPALIYGKMERVPQKLQLALKGKGKIYKTIHGILAKILTDGAVGHLNLLLPLLDQL